MKRPSRGERTSATTDDDDGNTLAVIALIVGALGLAAGETVKLSSFGSFIVRSKGERVGRNPKTGVEVPIDPRRVMVFKPSNVLKAYINGETATGED